MMSTSDSGAVSLFLNEKARYYGLASFDRPHVVKVNFIYNLPRFSRIWSNRFARQLLDSWQVTGISSFISRERRRLSR